jgi:hypothetical protein
MALFLLLSVSAFVGDEWSKSDPASVALYSIIGIGSTFGILRALRLGAVVDDRGIHLRNLGRGKFIAWRDVASIHCEIYDTRLGFPLYAPVVRLATPADPDDDAVALTALGSYRSVVAQRRADALAAGRQFNKRFAQ